MNEQIGNIQLMQKINRLNVLTYVRSHPQTQRPVIAHDTGLSLASITNITSYLLSKNLLKETGQEQVNRVGRKRTILSFNEDAFCLISVFIEENRVTLFLTNLSGRILEKTQINLTIKQTEMLIHEISVKAMELAMSNQQTVLALGVYISGLVLSDNRFVFSSSFRIERFNIRELLENEIHLPVYVENVSLISAQAYCTCQEPSENLVFLDLNNGIGAVQCINGKVNKNILGEIGHTTVEPNGKKCFCGNRGCLEQMCSPKRLLFLYNKSSGEHIHDLAYVDNLYLNQTTKNKSEPEKRRAEAAKNAIRECAGYLGIGMANIVNILNPSCIVMNVEKYVHCPSVIKEAKREMKKRLYPDLYERLEIVPVHLSEEEILRGSAYFMCERIFTLSFFDN